MIATALLMTTVIQVDLLELNKVEGRFTQVIYWEWHEEFRRMRPVGFHMVEEPVEYRIGWLPVKQPNGMWMVQTAKGTVFARKFRRSHTLDDPEAIARQLYK